MTFGNAALRHSLSLIIFLKWIDYSSKQQVDFQCQQPTQWKQESVSMRKSPTPVRHSYMNEARSEEKENRCQEADVKKGSLTKQKTFLRSKNKAYTYLGTAQVNKAGGQTSNCS